MNKPSPSLYERVAQQHASRFPGTYNGSVNAAALVVSSRQPSTAAKAALTASFRTLGYTSTSIGWAQTATSANGGQPGEPRNKTQEEIPDTDNAEEALAAPNSTESDAPVQPDAPNPRQTESSDLFTLVEAICPLCVVSLDRDAATALSHDFNTPLPLEARTLLMGHACICFQDFDSLLSSEEGKHKAWALLKTLPKMP